MRKNNYKSGNKFSVHIIIAAVINAGMIYINNNNRKDNMLLPCRYSYTGRLGRGA
jgi:hypothetical protein